MVEDLINYHDDNSQHLDYHNCVDQHLDCYDYVDWHLDYHDDLNQYLDYHDYDDQRNGQHFEQLELLGNDDQNLEQFDDQYFVRPDDGLDFEHQSDEKDSLKTRMEF